MALEAVPEGLGLQSKQLTSSIRIYSARHETIMCEYLQLTVSPSVTIQGVPIEGTKWSQCLNEKTINKHRERKKMRLPTDLIMIQCFREKKPIFFSHWHFTRRSNLHPSCSENRALQVRRLPSRRDAPQKPTGHIRRGSSTIGALEK